MNEANGDVIQIVPNFALDSKYQHFKCKWQMKSYLWSGSGPTAIIKNSLFFQFSC